VRRWRRAVLRPSSLPRVVIERVAQLWMRAAIRPKAVVGQAVVVEADIYLDGHEKPARNCCGDRRTICIRTALRCRPSATIAGGAIHPHLPRDAHFNIEAWQDVWGSYRSDLMKNAEAGSAGATQIEEGREQVLAALQRAPNAAWVNGGGLGRAALARGRNSAQALALLTRRRLMR
jgi:starch synthase (maltosyl-transferring)